MSRWIVASNDELYHHGIKGQKWGIRRWQNEDGSLTPEGVKRYGTVENFERAQKRKKIAIGVGAGIAGAAAIAGGTVLAVKNRDKLQKIGQVLQRTHEIRAQRRADAREKQNAWKNTVNNMRPDKAADLYDRMSGALQRTDNKKTVSNIKKMRRELSKKVAKKEGANVMDRLGSVPLTALRQAGSGEQGKQVVKNIASAMWATPITKAATGAGSALGAAIVGYGVKKMKDMTREQEDEEMANYMWQNPNKK